MTGVEIDFIVKDSLKALELYKEIFEVKTVEVTDFPKGQNEVIFSLYGVRFHMLDENPEYNMLAPDKDTHQTIWFNIMVPDINKVYQKAMDAGCTELQPVTEIPDFGVINAIFNDPFRYQWMLHEITREVSHEERVGIWEEKMQQEC